MKQILLMIAVVVVVFSTGCVWSTGAQKVALVEELPDIKKWQAETGTNLDAYVIYTEFTLFWIPVWNYEVRYVLCPSGSADRQRGTFYDFSNSSDVDALQSKHGAPSSFIPFWNRFGGKLVFLTPFTICIIGGMLAGPQQVHIMRNDQQLGTYTIEQASAMLCNGELLADDMACRKGEKEWRPINQVPGIIEQVRETMRETGNPPDMAEAPQPAAPAEAAKKKKATVRIGLPPTPSDKHNGKK
jgi:hypothetical protein